MSTDFASGAQIGKNIRAAKCVDCLLGIADQKQRLLRLINIERAEDAILLWISILEFINQGHRETRPDGFGQQHAAGLLQRLIQLTEQIVEA